MHLTITTTRVAPCDVPGYTEIIWMRMSINSCSGNRSRPSPQPILVTVWSPFFTAGQWMIAPHSVSLPTLDCCLLLRCRMDMRWSKFPASATDTIIPSAQTVRLCAGRGCASLPTVHSTARTAAPRYHARSGEDQRWTHGSRYWTWIRTMR